MSFGVKRLTYIFWQKKWGEMSFGVKRRREKCHGETCQVGRNVLHPASRGLILSVVYICSAYSAALMEDIRYQPSVQLPLWFEQGEPSCYCYSFQSSESILIWSKCATNLSIFSSKAALIFCRECICPTQGFGALGESELILNTIRGLRVRFGKYSIRRELQMLEGGYEKIRITS